MRLQNSSKWNPDFWHTHVSSIPDVRWCYRATFSQDFYPRELHARFHHRLSYFIICQLAYYYTTFTESVSNQQFSYFRSVTSWLQTQLYVSSCHLPFFSSQLPPALTLTLPDPAPPSDLWHDLYYNAREMSDTHLKEELIKWWHLEWYLQKLSNSSQKQSACTISTTGERKNVYC